MIRSNFMGEDYLKAEKKAKKSLDNEPSNRWPTNPNTYYVLLLIVLFIIIILSLV